MKKILFKIALLLAVIAAVVLIEVTLGSKSGGVKPASGAANPAMTLIIDAGHGGADSGAVSDSGDLRESGINLDIAQKLDLLAGFFGVRTAMTRESETIEYSENAKSIHQKKSEDTRNRLALINAAQNAVLISIHQNKYTSSGPFGAQVLYSGTNGSKEFAEKMQPLLISSLNPKNYRAAARIPSSIYIMNNVKCPAILIECGFISNESELALLKTGEYRLKIAAAIAAGYLSSQDLLKEITFGGINESQNSFLLY